MSTDTAKRASWISQSPTGLPTDLLSRTPLQATELAPLVNSYTISSGPPKTISVSNASKLALLQEITVSGTLLPKQLIRIDPRTNRRTVLPDAGGYRIEADGDLHFDLGSKSLQPHVTCELQNATSSLSQFKGSVARPIVVTGFFRCLFEHPGFSSNDDAHIFEIHPVREVNLDGKSLSFDVGIPDQKSIHTWTNPHPLNDQDNKIRVSFSPAGDLLTFTGMDGQDENYVQVPGVVSQIQLNSIDRPAASFVLTSPDIGRPIQAYSLHGTNATLQLAQLNTQKVSIVALRNIDLPSALRGRYVINLLAIDIQPA